MQVSRRIVSILSFIWLSQIISCIPFGHSGELDEFVINPKFKLELVASEPLVFDPVDLEFDENGDAYVLEMPGYPLNDEESRLVLLKDENNDGHYDKRIVFADSLNFASSIMPYKEGLLVAAPPNLLFLKDEDGDGKAEIRKLIMSGFADGNLQHNFNGLTYGLDNWIYAGNGGNDGQATLHSDGDSIVQLNMRGIDIRFKIDAIALESVGRSSGGFELAFDNWGRLFETHNTKTLLHLVFEDKYSKNISIDPGHTLSIIADMDENNLFRLYPIGEQVSRVNHPEQSGYVSGACGVTFYGGGAFPSGFNDQIFLADVVLNLVHLAVLSPDGASFKATRRRKKVEFLASTDRSFRPVNLSTGPDGSLYVLDMHREVIEHPEWIPDEIEENLDLEAGKDKGRIYRIIPKDSWKGHTFEGFQEGDINQFVKKLESPNQWTRMTAQRLIVESRNLKAVPLLTTLYRESKNPLARLHALWSLDGIKGLENDLLIKALQDSAPGIRENALKIIESRLHQVPIFMESIVSLVEDNHPRVRMQALLTLSKVPDDLFTLNYPNIHVAVSKLLEQPDIDQWQTLAATLAISRAPLKFCEFLFSRPLNEHHFEVSKKIARILGSRPQGKNLATFVDLIRTSDHLSSFQKATLIENLSNGFSDYEGKVSTYLSKNLTLSLIQLEKSGEIALIRACANLRNTLNLPASPKIKSLIVKAKAAVLNSTLTLEDRLEYLQLIGLDPSSQQSTLLFKLLNNAQPWELQKEALQQLRELDQTQIGPQVLENWSGLGPKARMVAANILLYKEENQDLLLTALENGKINLGEMNFDLERRRILLWSDNPKTKSRAEALFSDAGIIQRKEAIEKMRPALSLTGNIAKGQTIFQKQCSQCHQYANLGIEVGPNLTEISRKSKEALLHEILDPNAAVDPRYINHTIKTKAGEIYSGMIYQENDQKIILRGVQGIETSINKTDIEKLTALGISLMPEGQEANLSQQDMADLLAFLQQSPNMISMK